MAQEAEGELSQLYKGNAGLIDAVAGLKVQVIAVSAGLACMRQNLYQNVASFSINMGAVLFDRLTVHNA